jgi:perosamine synthetase
MALIGAGPLVTEFENKWSNHLGCKISVALTSGTAALHLALFCQNFPKRSKVLVPSLTFASTASAVLYCGLEPVFVDSDPVTLGICLDDLEKKYDKDCVAVIPVHLGGHPVAMERLTPWAKDNNLLIIEDCAHTSGSNYNGKNLGCWGDIGCFSFEEKKIMTTGDGGMICSNDASCLDNIRARRWVGMDKDNWKKADEYTDANHDAMHWFYEISELGYKYNMNDLAAAVGIAQLEKLSEMNSRRKFLLERYIDGLNSIDGIDWSRPISY